MVLVVRPARSELEHEFTTRLADALANARHLGGMDRQPVLEILLAAKVMPVRIPDPTGDDELVGEFEVQGRLITQVLS